MAQQNKSKSDLQEYIQKVMWYAWQEYNIPMISLEEFETMPHANIFMSNVLNFFLQDQPFQNCACYMVTEVMLQMGLYSTIKINPEPEEENNN
jgi:hypothetical protein